MSDQIMPHSIEAEEAVLGAVMINPDAFHECHALQDNDFFVVRHQWIWSAYRNILDREAALDYLTVVSELEQAGRLEQTGGAAYILSLISKTPSALNAEGYAQIVLNMAVRRGLLDVAQTTARLAHSDDTDLPDVIMQAQVALDGVSQRATGTIDAVSMRDLGESAYDAALAMAANPRHITGMACGISPLDRALGGFEPKTLTLLAGRTSMGKSALLVQMAVGFAKGGRGVLIFELEMSGESLFRRMACQIARVPSNKVRSGYLQKDDPPGWMRYLSAVETLRQLPIWIVSQGGLSVAAMRATSSSYTRQHGIGVVMIDTLNKAREVQHANGLYQGMTIAAHAAASMALNGECAVICAAQLSRKGEQLADKRPALDNLRDSGALEEVADVVMAVHRPGYYDPGADQNLMMIELLKNREGATGRAVKLGWDANWPGVYSLTPENTPPDYQNVYRGGE